MSSMEKKISEIPEELINSKTHDAEKLQDLINAIDEYKRLIDEGLTAKRGYNLLTTEEIFNPALNCSFGQYNNSVLTHI